MFAEKQVREWWQRCSEDQRARLKTAAGDGHVVDADTLKLLAATRVPYGPVGTKWEAEPDYSWTWPSEIRDFVLAQ